MTAVVLVFREPYATAVFGPLRTAVRDLSILAVASDLSTAIAAIAEHSPRAVVIGPSFLSEIPALIAATSGGIKPVVVLMVLATDASLRVDAVERGVDFVVVVDRGVTESLKCVASLLNGSDTADHLSSPEAGTPESFGLIFVRDDLDRRIVESIADGLGDRDICAAIFLSHQTVRNRISRILLETGVRNRTHLAVLYLRNINAGIDPFIIDR
jgi:DNA-binding NarL/FixJ family response regulator